MMPMCSNHRLDEGNTSTKFRNDWITNKKVLHRKSPSVQGILLKPCSSVPMGRILNLMPHPLRSIAWPTILILGHFPLKFMVWPLFPIKKSAIFKNFDKFLKIPRI